MMSAAHLALPFLIALAVAAALTPVIILLGRRGFLLDRPNERSSHAQPTPRGGGLAIVIAVTAAVAVFVGPGPMRTLLVAGLFMAVLGFLDDAFALPVWPRLLAQIAFAAWIAWAIGPIRALSVPGAFEVGFGPVAIPATVIWIVGVTNFFNFMDGIDGLAAGQSVLSAVVVVIAGWSTGASTAAMAIAGGCVGFLIYNWSPARIFMGDVGSMMLGFLLASLPLLAPAARRPDAVFATAIGLALFLLDPTFTLARKLSRGDRIGQSHRDHTYQQLVRVGEMHGPVTAGLLLATVPLALLGGWSFREPRFGLVAVLAALAVFVAEAALAGVIRKQKSLSNSSA
jgi:UDP-N-acetylmuramyl pentapeptide phosphotransferase/UDP-N-acetylglucosamine-1-phosphate transferase